MINRSGLAFHQYYLHGPTAPARRLCWDNSGECRSEDELIPSRPERVIRPRLPISRQKASPPTPSLEKLSPRAGRKSTVFASSTPKSDPQLGPGQFHTDFGCLLPPTPATTTTTSQRQQKHRQRQQQQENRNNTSQRHRSNTHTKIIH